MQRDLVVKSRSLGGSSDLTLLAPIKPGFVASLDSVTYKTRIKRVLEALHGARVASHEYATARLLSDSIERVGVIHSVRVAVVEPEDKVLLVVTFDGNWESYIRVLWDKVGTLLDLIFCGTVDYVTAYDHSFDEWLQWIRGVQIETGFFYGSADSTARDVLFQRRIEQMRMRAKVREVSESELHELRAVLPSSEEAVQRVITLTRPLHDDPPITAPGHLRMVRERLRSGLQALAGLHRLTDVHRPETLDGVILRRAAINLLLEFVQMHDAKLVRPELVEARDRFARQLDWLFPDGDEPVALTRPVPLDPAQRGPIEGAVRADIQGGILRPYEKITHGLVLLLAFDNAHVSLAFLNAVEGLITTDAEPTSGQPGTVFRNVALTPAGLRVIGLSEDELDLFPEEFRQGMAARPGLLGDLRNNHPRRWRLPRRFAGIDEQEVQHETVGLDAIHAVLQLRCEAKSEAELAAYELSDPRHPLRDEVKSLQAAIPKLRILAVQPLRRNYRQENGEPVIVEHFGYADGNGQPEVEAGRFPYSRNRINLGEIVHGHDNAADFAVDPADPSASERMRRRLRWLANSSFLVMRKYRQFTERMDAAVTATAVAMADKLGGDVSTFKEIVYGKLMGRTLDGRPVVAPDRTDRDQVNLFDYEDDKQGQLCPLHAHIRRAHPRSDPDSIGRAARIMRRSMSYGPSETLADADAETDRGLLFMAYNADIAQQFEVIQRWLVGGNSTGASSGPSCPFVGVPENGVSRHYRFEYEAAGVSHIFRVTLEPDTLLFEEPEVLTRLEWGMYLFAPSLGTLSRLQSTASCAAARAPAVTAPWQTARGRELIAKLKQIEAEQGAVVSTEAWKAIVEDPDSIDRLESAAVWSSIRSDHGGILKTPYGTLVASRDLITTVLLDDLRYSISGQFERMKRSVGEIYLGMDAGSRYENESGPINEAIGNLTNSPQGRQHVFEIAFQAARKKLASIIHEAKKHSNDVCDTRFEVGFEAREVVDEVLADLCEAWFGVSDGIHLRRGGADWAWTEGKPPLYPGHFTALSRYMFQPNPGPIAIELGERYGRALQAAMEKVVAEHLAAGTVPTLRDGSNAPIAFAIFNHPIFKRDGAWIARTMVGVMMGFVAPIIGAVLNVLREWQRDGSFSVLRFKMAGRTGYVDALAVLRSSLASATGMRPMPQIVWRTASQSHRLGSVDVLVGDKLVLGLVSGTQQSLAEGALGKVGGRLMFGGVREDAPHPTHACPGYSAGTGAMLGTLTALLSRGEEIRPGPAPLTFVVEGPSGYVPVPPEKLVVNTARAEAMVEYGLQVVYSSFFGAPLIKRTGRILAWGDSWLDYRAEDPFGLGLGLDLGTDLRDCLERRGYTLPKDFCVWTDWTKAETMAASPGRFAKFLRNELQLRKPRAILLSGGGNDSTEGTMQALIYPKDAGKPTGLDPVALDTHIKRLRSNFVHMLDAIKTEFAAARTVPVLVHGYDYPIPAGVVRPRWLREPFEAKGYHCDIEADLKAASLAMRELINGFNAMLEGLKDEYPFVVYVKLSGTIEDKWKSNPADGWVNDLHPQDEAFALMAEKIEAAIERLPQL